MMVVVIVGDDGSDNGGYNFNGGSNDGDVGDDGDMLVLVMMIVTVVVVMMVVIIVVIMMGQVVMTVTMSVPMILVDFSSRKSPIFDLNYAFNIPPLPLINTTKITSKQVMSRSIKNSRLLTKFLKITSELS